MANTTVATAFARALRAAGVQRVYGLPGEDHLRLLDAIATQGLTYVGAREESAAVIMAAAEAQATGVPGVALVTIAPGITNAINGIAHAWLDNIPLLVVCGQHTPDRAPVIVRQLLDNHQLLASITKWTATSGARIHQVLAKSLDTALAPPCGPVFLELRDDVAGQTPLDHLEDWPLLRSTTHFQRPVSSIPEEVAAMFRSARRPVVIVGADCPHDDAVRAEIRHWPAPVFTSPAAMGMVASDNVWFAGTFMNGNFEAELLARSDLIVTLGLNARDFFNAAWRYAAPVVAISLLPDVQRFVPTGWQLVGDVASTFGTACRFANGSEWRPEDVAAYRASVDRPFHLRDEAFTIPSALRTARSILPPETVVAVDAGFGKPLASYLWSAPTPHRYFTAHGLSTMGYALPAANALQLTYPDRPVVAFTGDGSLFMRASEISVAVEHACGPVVIAWMDGALAQIETKQLRQQLRPVGARLPAVSCAKIAEAFGAVGCDVETLSDFADALEQALQSKQPTLIGAHVDQSHRAEWYELMRG